MAHEFDGDKYKKASTHQKEWGSKLISEIDFTDIHTVLDLGCGEGSLTAELARMVPEGKVVGIDASMNMIRTAERNQAGNNLTFMLMDINDMAFEIKFDLIFSNATLHWIKDHRNLMQRVTACLAEKGKIRFNFAADGNCAAFYRVIREVMYLDAYKGYFKAFEWPWYMPSLAEYQELLKTCSFSDLKVWGENADRTFPDVKAMTGWVEQPSIVPFLKCVDDRDKKAFKELVIERMIEATRQPDGTCFETFRRINVSATA